MKFCSNQVNKLFTCIKLFEENAGKGRGGCYRVLFLNTPDLHAHMLSFNDNRNSQRMKGILDTVSDLGGESFLNLKPS